VATAAVAAEADVSRREAQKRRDEQQKEAGMRALAIGGAIVAVVLALSQGVGASGPGSRPPVPCPAFDAGNFHSSTTIDNQYFPLAPRTRFTYKGHDQKAPVLDVVTVTRNTPTIDGVETVEVRDQVKESGVLTEDTLDWYAQDDEGNVWYFGELATQLPEGTHEGSWTAGDPGAQPGLIMEAAPRPGDSYCQENAPGVAEDAGQVISVTESRTVPFDSFSGYVLQTKDYSLIEPKNENKFYASGVGMIEAISTTGPSEDIQLYEVGRGG
jgi:hypothetical protein